MSGIERQYVDEILAAAKAAGVKTRAEWRRLTSRDRAAGYHDEVAEAERLYFSSDAISKAEGL